MEVVLTRHSERKSSSSSSSSDDVDDDRALAKRRIRELREEEEEDDDDEDDATDADEVDESFESELESESEDITDSTSLSLLTFRLLRHDGQVCFPCINHPHRHALWKVCSLHPVQVWRSEASSPRSERQMAQTSDMWKK